DETLRLAAEFDRPVIVQLGAGLDTRPLRLQSALPSATFCDLDLPDVIAVRDALLPKAKNNFSLPYSMLDHSWMDELVAKHGSAGYIFILEGVSMYFEKEEFKKFFIALSQKFSGYVLSDFMSEFSVRKFDSKRHDAMRHMQNAPFKMGIGGGAEVQSWEPERIRFIKEAAMLKMYKSRWSLKGRLFSLIPAFCNACKMFVFKIGGDE
ncbi:class I SAM-dependent methyltransferase, partial [uncultured Campylobacter sp.]|uniref:class I SAM-dependent methyltransferase n=1 Tax=uncultured Campylobacter sp. TaxID=218934 RepID=UPI002611ED63